jgi:thiol:disulfide interchange protein DsbD
MWVNALTTLLWAGLGLSAFSYYYVINAATPLSFAKGVRAMLIFTGLFVSALYGASYFISASTLALQGHSPQSTEAASVAPAHPRFLVVKDLGDFDAKLGQANAEGKSVMVDLYADWCVACKEFEKYTFPDPAVIAALDNTVWMQIDLTDNTPTNLAFQNAFNVLGLPTILFFDASGEELSKARVTGFMDAKTFAAHVNKALKRPD